MWGRLITAYKCSPRRYDTLFWPLWHPYFCACKHTHSGTHTHTHSLTHVSAKTTMTIVQETKIRRRGQKGNLYFLPLKSLLRAEGNRVQILSRVRSVISSALQVMISQPDSPLPPKKRQNIFI